MDANVACDYKRGTTMWSFVLYVIQWLWNKCIKTVTIEGN